MAENKSIDGLSTHADKKAKSTPKKSKKTVKTVSPEDFASTPDSNIWDSIIENNEPEKQEIELIEEIDEKVEEPKEEIKKPAKKPKRVDGFTPIKKAEKPLNFLKPVAAYDFDEEEGLLESEDTVEDMKNIGLGEKEIEEKTEEKDEEPEMTAKELKKKAKLEAKKAKKDAKKKPSKKRKIITITALVIVLLMIGIVVWAIFWGNDIIAKITGGRGNIFDFFVETYEPLKTDANGRTNILAIGTGGYNMDGDEGNGVHDGAQLTDSIMLISFDQNTGDVAMISLPRDLKGPATCTSTGKINEVYWCNGGGGDASVEQEEKAATAVMDAVGSILGVDIQYYAHLNWGSLASIVDLLGGITVTLDEDINDYNYTEAVFKAGVPYDIDGAQAVGLARARHGTTGGDFSRGQSQQKIIVGIKNKLLEKNLSITDMLSLVSTLGDNLRTNFSVAEIKTLGHDLTTLDFDVMRHISLYPDYMTTGMLNGISYVLPKAGAGNYKTIQLYVAKQLSSDPRDYEEPTIAIYNASDTDGLASEEKIKLENKGYTINLIDNAPEGEYEQGTSIYVVNPEKAGTKRMLEEEYNYTPKGKDELPTTIAPNYDFIIILNNK
ncbi:MAG: LCP family protein [Candidatus Saccharibacteria bacterium]|nr:LCP family protein [Candidatus Saccharibacteria bacterium]